MRMGWIEPRCTGSWAAAEIRLVIAVVRAHPTELAVGGSARRVVHRSATGRDRISAGGLVIALPLKDDVDKRHSTKSGASITDEVSGLAGGGGAIGGIKGVTRCTTLGKCLLAGRRLRRTRDVAGGEDGQPVLVTLGRCARRSAQTGKQAPTQNEGEES